MAGDSILVELKSLIQTEGSLKVASHLGNLKAGDFRCAQLDAKGRILASISIPNQLQRNIEFVTDSGHFDRKNIIVEKAQCPIRMQLHPQSKSIVFERFQSDPDRFIRLSSTDL